jgi:hypothetical protein
LPQPAAIDVHVERTSPAGNRPRLAGWTYIAATLQSNLASDSTNTATAEMKSAKEIAMFASTGFSRITQRAVCMLVSVVIVAAALSFGVYKTHVASQSGYSVTVTQLQ